MRTRRVSRIRSIRSDSDGAFPSNIAVLPPDQQETPKRDQHAQTRTSRGFPPMAHHGQLLNSAPQMPLGSKGS